MLSGFFIINCEPLLREPSGALVALPLAKPLRKRSFPQRTVIKQTTPNKHRSEWSNNREHCDGHVSTAVRSMIDDGIDGVVILTDNDNLKEIAACFTQLAIKQP